MDNEMTMRLAVVGIAALAAVAVWLLMKRRRTAALRARFGPEYDRVLETTSTPAEAERQLYERQRRVESFSLRSLSREQAEQYTDTWRSVQARFVDDPRGAVVEADRLIEDVMRPAKVSVVLRASALALMHLACSRSGASSLLSL